MPPGLRSAAPSTPSKATTTRSLDTDVPTPRKSPHCKTCGRPRKGHPLRACGVESLLPSDPITPSKPSAASITTTHDDDDSPSLVQAMDALSLSPAKVIEHEERDKDEKRTRRKSLARQQNIPIDLQSLPSISSFTGGLLDGLTLMSPKQGVAKDEDDQGSEGEVELLLEADEIEHAVDKRETILQWRDANGTPRKVRFNAIASAAQDETTPTKVLRPARLKSRISI
ncbi:hypothetical protein MIND_00793400 [Mycena indigotica]|uniref:Uncharacterized protein n=1 Tax=Mycena indigotica TaxID=2126181 RepID=A0A8H6SMB7_9AGAR|nr:uncharacterized protein MIND_00793400 [Mycena indigotica]KAF7302263.1 hypothetical protein MIND_00793400 [Mycena indigotica]